MNILEKNQKTDKRFQRGDFILYEPNEQQIIEIKNLLEKQNIKAEGDSIKGETDISFLRFIIRELTSIGHTIDEYNDIELEQKIDNGNRDLQLLVREIEILINEIVEDMAYFAEKQLSLYSQILNVMSRSKAEQEIEDKFNKLMKKNKIDTNFREFLEHQDDPDFLNSRKKVNKRKSNK